jgi:hypothetical protein
MQPLDRFVFGVMKAHGLRYRTHVSSLEKVSKQVAAAFLMRTWEAVSPAVVNDAWALSKELEEDEQ